MELKSILKQEIQKLKRCERLLKNVKVLYWKKENAVHTIDLYDKNNEDMITRIELRHQIRKINKQINFCLIEKLKSQNIDPKPYMKNYWNEIVQGFALAHNKYKTEDSFQKAYLYDKNSKLYRRFQDCITAGTMRNYIIYLRNYLDYLSTMRHEEALSQAKKELEKDKTNYVKYQEPALPLNWADIYEQIKYLKSKDMQL